MDLPQPSKDQRWSEPYSPVDSAIWHDPMADSTPRGSSVTLLPLKDQYEIFSSFGEQDCGEPSSAQHVVFDFTPDPKIDNTETQKKCCAFWDFIKKQQYMHKLCVIPTPPPVTVSQKIIPKVEPVENIPAAITVLERDSNDIIKHAFDARMPKSKCSLRPDSYNEEDPTIRKKDKMTLDKPLKICTCSGTCTKCKKTKSKPAPGKIPTEKLCKIFDEWDKNHPKSMEPPGPVMQKIPTLQRKIPPDQKPKTCLD